MVTRFRSLADHTRCHFSEMHTGFPKSLFLFALIIFMRSIYNYTPRFYGIRCCSYSVVTIYGTGNVMAHDNPLYLYTEKVQALY